MRTYPWKQLLLFSLIFLGIASSSFKIFTKNDYEHQLSVIAIFQNEDRFLKEWIDFYRVQGVGHFYLFNNLSEDNYQQVLAPYIRAGIVDLYDWPYQSQPGDEAEWNRIQSAAYREGLALAKGKSKWVALLDIDEYMFPKQKDCLVSFLEDYEECSGILINWQLFGTSNINRIPENQFMIETLVMQAPIDSDENKFCKSIVRPEKVKYCREPQAVIYYPWSYSVDPDKRIFEGEFHRSRWVNIEKIQINHYWSRDEEFFYTNKLARYENWGNQKLSCVRRNEEANCLKNHDILSWVPSIRKLQQHDPILSEF